VKIRVMNRPVKLIATIKSIREASGQSLMEAKKTFDQSLWFEVVQGDQAQILEDLSELGAVIETKHERVKIKAGWGDAGQEGRRLGPDVFVEQEWTPVLWDGQEDPDWHKASGLEPA